MVSQSNLTLYDEIKVYEDILEYDSKLLSNILHNLDILRDAFSPDQIRFIRYLVVLDMNMAKEEISRRKKELIKLETEGILVLFNGCYNEDTTRKG